jgi:hypothetical protein
MKLTEIKASRQYGWVFIGPVNLLKGGRGDLPENPLLHANVEQRAVYCGQAATHEMYCNAQRKIDPNWQPSDRKAPFTPDAENPCVVLNGEGVKQVRILNPIKSKVQYTVNGQPATADQIATIEQYKGKHSRPEGGVKIMFPYVHNLSNVE